MISSKSSQELRPYGVALIASIALHLIFLVILLRTPNDTLPDSTVIDVSFEPARSTASPKQQIVSPPQSPSQKPPEKTDRVSDVDATAIKEQVKRGTEGGLPGEAAPPSKAKTTSAESPPAVSQPPPSPPNSAKAPPPSPRKPSPPSTAQKTGDLNLRDLKLDDATLAMKFGAPQKAPSQTREDASSSTTDLSKYAAFSRPPGSGATFVGSGGISDHLPNLPDGDITLLNAKANTYAGFVRRVAIQVFTQLRTQGWERLHMSEVRQIGGFTTIEAILSPEGKFISMQLVDSSGSSAFDGVVQQSVASGARDPNPPSGARATDGRIHFIFKARSWTSVGVNARAGVPVEHRWLLLATGLE